MNSAALAAAASRASRSVRSGKSLGGELLGPLPQAGHLGDALEHGLGRQRVADLDALARLEVFDDRPQLAEIEVDCEDVLDRLVDDAMDQLVFVPFVFGHGQLELAARAGGRGDRSEMRGNDPALAAD